MTGIEPVTSCFEDRRSVPLSYILIKSIDGSCTLIAALNSGLRLTEFRSYDSVLERHSDFSNRPRCFTGMMGFEPTVFRSTGDCFEPD